MMRSRTLRLSLCLLLAIAAVLLGALSVRRKVASFQPLGFTAQRSGALVQVARVDSPASGLAAGDEILLVDGAETGGAEALTQHLRERQSADLAVLRAGQVIRLTYHRPPVAPDYPFLILVLIGSAYLLIGLYTLIRQQSAESFLFCLWCLLSALLYLLTPVPPADAEYRLVYFGDQLARCLLPAVTLHLFLVFPSSPAAPRPSRAPAGGTAGDGATARLAGGRRRSWIPFLYLPGAALLALQLDLMLWNGRHLFGRPTVASLAALDRIDLLHLVAFGLAAAGVLTYRLLREPGWEERRQLHWMIFGLVGGYLPFLALYLVPFVLGFRLPPLANAAAVLPLALVPLTFAYAILRYKLWDIEVIARDVVSATLTLLLGALGFSLANLAITRGVSAELPLARNLLSFAAGIGIAGLLVPTRHTLSAALERLQYRGTFGKRRALLGLGRDLLHERDLGRLCGALLDRLAGGMDLDRAGLYLSQGDRLVAVDAIDLRPRPAASIFDPAPDAGAAGRARRSRREGMAAPDELHPPHPPTSEPGDPSGSPNPAVLRRLFSGGHANRLRRTLAGAAPPVLSARALDPAVWLDNEAYRLAGTELPGGPPSPLQLLFIAGYRYAFPLTVRGRGIGLVLTGFKRDQAPLSSEDFDLIRHLLNQAALAIENAQLVGQLHLQLDEVQRLQRYSDGIFESSPAGIAVLDGGQHLVSVNPAFAALVGRERGELLGRSLPEVLPLPQLPEPGQGPVELCCAHADGPQGAESRDRPEGSAGPAGSDHGGAVRAAGGAGGTEGARPGRYLQVSLADLVPGGGPRHEPLRILMVYDVSERVAMEKALKEKDRLAALGLLAAGVAHEVNTPITGISSYAQMLLADTAESDPRFPILKKVERQTFRAASIVNNLLEFARERRRERRPVAVLPLLRECVELFADRCERAGVEVVWELPAPAGAEGGGERLQVLGSDGELQQVFTNLLGNAFDAMSGQAGARLTIALAAGAETVTVAFADTGPGVPPERLATIFEPFFSTKLHRGGTGLGLTICHDIVQRHGGRLEVESTPGVGARFSVELPRLQPAAAAATSGTAAGA